jgi:8-oxo-dGTP diphosphatase
MDVSLSVSIAVIQDGKVLLIKREDFEVWGLPSGFVEEYESISEAAIRETFEEVGLVIKLVRLVGIYSLPEYNKGNHTILFSAIPIGGNLKLQETEVLALDYFDPMHLPHPLIWWHRQRIIDALQDRNSVIRSQNVIWPFDVNMTRQDLYNLRDESGISRQEFFLRHFSRPLLSCEDSTPDF